MTVADQIAAAIGGQLQLAADLRIEVDGRPLHLTGADRQLILRADDASDLRSLALAGGGVGDARRLATELDALGLTLDVHDGQGLVARLGREGRTGPVARLVGAPVALGPRGRRSLSGPLLAVVAIAALVVAWRRLRGG